MRRVLVNISVSCLGAWFLLLDRCLVVTADAPVSGEVLTLVFLQGSIVLYALLLLNGAFPTLAAMARDGTSTRTKLLVFGLPLILFLISPVMISDSIYRVRYGNMNKFLVRAQVGHDMSCCWSFSALWKS